VVERAYWKQYQAAYQDMVRNTATENAPWYVIPADKKWFARLVVSCVIVDALAKLKLAYPEVDAAKKKTLAAAREKLLKMK
jgi:polyphosphate kinase 2 (PPK2 family)